MPVFTPEEIDVAIQQDLKDEIIELYEASEQCLVELEITPDDKELQRALFRNVHTIKGDLGLVGYAPMISVLQDLEDVLDLMRKDQIKYSDSMHDLVLGMLDLVSEFVNVCIEQGKAEYDQAIVDAVNELIRQIKPENSDEHDVLLSNATKILKSELSTDSSLQKNKLLKTAIPKGLSKEKHEDLVFFREIIRSIEKRAGYDEGRGERIARLALFINSQSDRQIPEEQLAVACYVHDFGMAFMPHDVIQKDKLSPIETNLLRSHVYKSTRLLEHLKDWDEARKIVMQHHENIDGSGYPLGIKGDDMCEGAKLLAIIDRYEHLMHGSVESENIAPKQAIIALNQNNKGKVSNYWLRLFNQSITKVLNSN